MVGMIIVRTVHRDISRYNAIDMDEDVQEDFGWKLVHGEVFRPPRQRMLLSIVVGSGIQLAAMSGVTLCMYFAPVLWFSLTFWSVCLLSFRLAWFPFSIESRIAVHRYDCLLDVVWCTISFFLLS